MCEESSINDRDLTWLVQSDFCCECFYMKVFLHFLDKHIEIIKAVNNLFSTSTQLTFVCNYIETAFWNKKSTTKRYKNDGALQWQLEKGFIQFYLTE